MNTATKPVLTLEQKAAKKAKRRQRWIEQLREEMRKDVEQLRRIIDGQVKKPN
jgi:uncharacterized protein YnzC (UPF0291/DUF896 family)